MEIQTRKIAIPSEIEKTWQRIVNVISDLICVPSVMINRLNPPELEVFSANLSPGNPFPARTRMEMAGVYCETTARLKQRLKISDARKDPEWAGSPTARAGIFAYLGFPLCWPDGKIFGTLCAVDTKENKWGEQYESLLLSFKEGVEAHLALLNKTKELERKNKVLEKTLGEVKTLRRLMPICASCKKIRDDKGYWNQIEEYLGKHADVWFSHGICPDCARRLYPGLEGL
ncbi:GAF domain-containing protein [Desulfospira joergensenii]|uniref:GAF domain-containing protein n=1 Tax=Desulfospira joergensenii TaxID=53329 RepID=UPI0003B39B4F|nr:GAF domain-containing protein [Desulfospira joergensenii]